jgi:MFS family permease
MKDLFRNRSYLLLFTGNLVSKLGNVLFSFVAGLYIADITGLPSMLAVYIAVGSVVRIISSPIAGVLIDRWNKLRIIYATDILRGLMFVITSYLFYNGVNQSQAFYILILVVSLSSFLGAFFGPAVVSVTPEIVGDEKLQAANGANNISASLTSIVGIVLGAIAFSLFSFEFAVLLNGISFIMSGISEMFIKARYKIDHTEAKKSFFEDIRVGFKYIIHHDGLLSILIFSLLLSLSFAPLFSVGVPSLMRIQLTRSAWEIGWLDISFSVAMLFTGVFIGSKQIKNVPKMIQNNLVYLLIAFITVSVNILCISINLYDYVVFYTIFIVQHIILAIFLVSISIPLNTSIVKVIEPSVRGRVLSTIGALSSALAPLFIVLGGLLIEVSSVSVLAFVCSLLLVYPTIGFLRNGKITKLLTDLDIHQMQQKEDNE